MVAIGSYEWTNFVHSFAFFSLGRSFVNRVDETVEKMASGGSCAYAIFSAQE